MLFRSDEMAKVKSAAVNIIKMNEVTQQPVWKSLYSINEMVDSYVAITDEQGEISQFTGIALLEEDVEKIINNSNNIKSLIKFKKEGSVYCVTYNYPIYLEQQLYGNLIIQKDYSNKYNNNLKTISIIILGQAITVLAISLIINKIITREIKPLQILSSSMEEFRRTNNSDDVIIISNDEIGSLSESYNLMKNDLSRQMQIIIDEKEKIEKLQKSSREFFNNATHELKTPVTAISLYAQTLKENNIKDLEEDFIIV